MTIQESTAVRPERYEVHDLADDIRGEYYKLVIFKSYKSSLSDLLSFFDQVFSGTVIIDTLFSAGNNSNRFLKAVVTDGKMDPLSVEVVSCRRHHPVRAFSNNCIMQDPDGLEASVLVRTQKQLLLKGVSI
ncbi:type II toxin-antitoxin system RnlB family antitoxin [Halalkalibacter sp. APA_J-10(15)]|uniref:type II toxin-antitoxin system RnlB family antitoxin n=1 Tax=Halalkalibacter sp. APA_J-10(15) TaxID=2933805 RepID=UPI001FF454E0|nr:type II toxin-antitoxin system RnlB family antitoxin [Halalkalibacter sp. APA_J-10(15)]MCK0473369.1 type II toxin-antitoxin system RnlB family antitoxin [Halalkalibacter sp. APA_J-10(15)]